MENNPLANDLELKNEFGKSFKDFLKLCTLFAEFIQKLDFVIFDHQYSLDLKSPDGKHIAGYLKLELRNKYQYEQAIKMFSGSKVFRALIRRKFRNVYCMLKFKEEGGSIRVFDTRHYF